MPGIIWNYSKLPCFPQLTRTYLLINIPQIHWASVTGRKETTHIQTPATNADTRDDTSEAPHSTLAFPAGFFFFFFNEEVEDIERSHPNIHNGWG